METPSAGLWVAPRAAKWAGQMGEKMAARREHQKAEKSDIH